MKRATINGRYMRFTSSVFLLFVLSLSQPCARPLAGLSVDANAGIAPLVLLNNDDVGFHLAFPLPSGLQVETLSELGFSAIGVAAYFLIPEPGPIFWPWFNVGEEISLSFPLRLGENSTGSVRLRVTPISIAITWAPLYYLLLGAGAGIALELENKTNGRVFRPIAVYGRVCYRPNMVGYHLLFQAGVRVTRLW